MHVPGHARAIEKDFVLTVKWSDYESIEILFANLCNVRVVT